MAGGTKRRHDGHDEEGILLDECLECGVLARFLDTLIERRQIMKLSDYIAQLEDIKATHGDLDVKGVSLGNGGAGAVDARKPVVTHLCKLVGRNWVVRFWNTWDGDGADKMGDEVVRV